MLVPIIIDTYMLQVGNKNTAVSSKPPLFEKKTYAQVYKNGRNTMEAV